MTMLRSALLVASVAGVDLATKGLARNFLVEDGSVDLFLGASLALSYNSGMAFGLLQGMRGLLLLGGSAIVAGLIFWLRHERSRQSRVGLSLILGGALGNLVDRFARGVVTDFIDLQAFGLHWPTFNLADTALTFGVGLLLFDRRRRPDATPPKDFIPALGIPILSPLYDLAIAVLTREKTWRGALLAQLDPRPGDMILDVGCGTGTFALMIKRACPDCTVVGIDPDPSILDRARRKAAAAGAAITFLPAYARDSDASGGPFTKVVSSLVLHQVPVIEKELGLAAIFRSLAPGGHLHVADYGVQRTTLMRRLFRIVEQLDGQATTRPNAEGIVPRLMEQVGFVGVTETRVIPTPTGSISLYSAVAP